MRGISILLIFSILAFITQIILFFSGIFKPFDIIYVIMAGAAAISMALASRHGHSPVSKRICSFLALGLLLWTIAEAIWMYFELIVGIEVPYPSIADAFWLAGYLPMFYGFYVRRRELFVAKTRTFATSAIGILLFFAAIYLLIPIISEVSGIERATNIAYVAFDFVLIILTLNVLLAGSGKFMLPWLLLAIAVFMSGIYDFMFAWLTAKDLYRTGHPIDLLYAFSYLLITLAAYHKFKYPEMNMS